VSGAAVAAVQVDDTTNSTDTTDATDTVDPAADPGTHLRELLQGLVDDGTITADQADKVAEYLVENRPERGDHGDRRGGHRGPGRDGEVVAGLIGIDVDTLRTELRNGKSVAEIAEANGVDPQTVIDALVDEASGHLDLAVTDGRLTADEAAQALDRMTERITARVNGERPARG
jgi:polyhydroxyalkanoate synthesis regulator phasin